MKKMNKVLAVLGLVAVLVMNVGCDGDEGVVKKVMDAVLSNHVVSAELYEETARDEIYDLMFHYIVRAYSIKNVTDSVVAVEITFASQAFTDLKKTWRFKVANGKIVQVLK